MKNAYYAALLFAAISSAAPVNDPAAAQGRSVVAGGMAAIDRAFPSAAGYDDMTFEITIAQEPGYNGRTYWAHQFALKAPADGGYVGLQARSANEKVINFSIWKASGWHDSAGANCSHFAHEGDGVQCWKTYAWKAGVTYQLRVERAGQNAWKATVTDTVTGVETPVATIDLPADMTGGLTTLSEWVENFAQGNEALPSCEAVPKAVAVYGIPHAQRGSVSPQSSTPRTYGNCASIASARCAAQRCVLSANPSGFFASKQLLNKQGNLCLDLLGGGNNAGLYHCDRNANQLMSYGTDLLIRVAGRNNECLSAMSSSVVSAPCSSVPAQLWVRLEGSRAYLNLGNGQCMDAAGGAVVEAPVQTTKCLANSYQSWAEQ